MNVWGAFIILLFIITILSGFLNIGLFVFFGIITLIIAISSIKVVYSFEKGVVFTLGKYTGMLNQGLNFIIPFIQRAAIVDLRLNVTDVPQQAPITKDNVSISVDAVIYYKIMAEQAEKSIIKVENFRNAISQLAQTTMRNVIGEMTLDEVLSNRDEASGKIKIIVDKASDPWGIKVEAVELKHIELPESMKTIMAKGAEAERIKRALIIKASGEVMASKIVSQAAETISSVEGGLNLRTLQELDNIASDQSNEVLFFVPLDMVKPVEGYAPQKIKKVKK
jgi:regulator of protease activity HflC (stomatin/prohibitin superfamily)